MTRFPTGPRLAAVCALLTFAALVLVGIAAAGEHPAKNCRIRFTQLEQVRYVHAVYRRPAISWAAQARMKRMQRCAYSVRAAANMAAVQTLAARARARRLSITPFLGPDGQRWAIPWVIVNCESRGKNEPPNHAGASGYYQFIPPTWKWMGGPTSDAYLASRAVQAQIAARLWNGGRGSGHWDCTAIVGWRP